MGRALRQRRRGHRRVLRGTPCVPVKSSELVFLRVVLMRCGFLAWQKRPVTRVFRVCHGAVDADAWAPVRRAMAVAGG